MYDIPNDTEWEWSDYRCINTSEPVTLITSRCYNSRQFPPSTPTCYLNKKCEINLDFKKSKADLTITFKNWIRVAIFFISLILSPLLFTLVCISPANYRKAKIALFKKIEMNSVSWTPTLNQNHLQYKSLILFLHCNQHQLK